MWRGWNEISFLAGYFELASALPGIYADGVYSFRLSVRPFVCSFVCSFVSSFVR